MGSGGIYNTNYSHAVKSWKIIKSHGK